MKSYFLFCYLWDVNLSSATYQLYDLGKMTYSLWLMKIEYHLSSMTVVRIEQGNICHMYSMKLCVSKCNVRLCCLFFHFPSVTNPGWRVTILGGVLPQQSHLLITWIILNASFGYCPAPEYLFWVLQNDTDKPINLLWRLHFITVLDSNIPGLFPHQQNTWLMSVYMSKSLFLSSNSSKSLESSHHSFHVLCTISAPLVRVMMRIRNKMSGIIIINNNKNNKKWKVRKRRKRKRNRAREKISLYLAVTFLASQRLFAITQIGWTWKE